MVEKKKVIIFILGVKGFEDIIKYVVKQYYI